MSKETNDKKNHSFENLIKIDPSKLDYDPRATTMFTTLQTELQRLVKKERSKGYVFDSKVRWDLKDQEDFDEIPLETLLDDPYYGGGKYYVEQIGDITKEYPGIWPVHRQDIIDLYAEKKKNGVEIFVDIEGIGSGKTHKFRTILRIEMLKVLTRVSPLEWYGLDPKGQGISFVCMSRNAQLAKQVTFNTVLKAFDCPFFNEYFPPQVNLAEIQETQKYPSILRFPKDVVIFPGSGSALSAIGYNLMGGGIDEANYLEVVEGSKKAWGGGVDYDSAEIMFNAIYDRMTSRFVGWASKNGHLPGVLMLFSNTKHSTDFLERMSIKAKKDKKLFLRRRCTWEGHPKEQFCGEVFYFDIVNRRICDKDGKPLLLTPKGLQPIPDFV